MFLVAGYLFLLNFHFNHGLRILMVDHLASPSHQIWNYAIAEELLQRGHNVTLLGPLTIKPIVHDNYTHLIIEDLYKNVMQHFDQNEWSGLVGPLGVMYFFYDYCIYDCKYSLESKGFKSLLNYENDSFDVILVDQTLGNCMNPLIQKFNYAPTVGLTAFLLPSYLSYDFGNGIYPGYIPNYYVRYTDDMTFFQRLENYIYSYLDIYLREFALRRHVNKIALKAFGDGMESPDILQQHVSLLLANWNPALHYPQPVTPNIIPVGGAHIKNKPLNGDLRQILDNAKNGVILFSLGTNINSADLSPDKRKIIIDVLGRLKQTVIWKFEAEISGLPKNVIVRKWLPQTDVLAHPNMKLFISHCGGLSTVEAAHFGVPVLGIPFTMDQQISVRNLMRKKLALMIDFDTLTTEIFYQSIQEMVKIPSYNEGWKELSRRFRDQQNPPLDRAIFWIEYVARHNGSLFLSPKSRTLSSFVSSCMDIYLFFLAIFLLIIYVCFKLGKYIRSKKGPKIKTN